MRIAQITAFYLPSQGGIQYYVQQLSAALTRDGHQVDIITVNTENVAPSEQRGEGMVYRCARTASYHRGLVSVELASRLLRQRDYDVLHVHVPFPLGLELAAIGGVIGRTPLVVTHHGTGPKDDRLYTAIAGAYDRVFRQFSLRLVDAIVFLTESYRDELRLSPRSLAKSRVVRTGADVERFSPQVDGGAIRARYGLAPDDVVCLWVGSLNEHNRYKGIDRLLDALAREDGPRVSALLVGDGPLRAELEAHADARGLRGRVRFAGAIPNEQLPAYYAAADLFVLPSISGPENSPVVVFEAMATGKPVVASSLPGVREIVRDGDTGLLVPPRDVAALAGALSRLAADPSLRARLGRQGRALTEHQTWDHCAGRMNEIYHAVAGNTPAAVLASSTRVPDGLRGRSA